MKAATSSFVTSFETGSAIFVGTSDTENETPALRPVRETPHVGILQSRHRQEHIAQGVPAHTR
jgi:hypothetical protein